MKELYMSKVNAKILPLHGELAYAEQKKCFDSYFSPNVIVATNVAQTSITIPNISAVVDTGKENQIEAHNGIKNLVTRNISQADILQRKCRAGRTRNGKYILCSNVLFEERPEFTVPEIQRTLLNQKVLRLAAQRIDAVDFEFFHQPDIEEIKRAKQTLIDLGALSKNDEVTPIRYKMAKMPVSVESARMIAEAEKYGVTEEVIYIASILEFGGLLMRDIGYRKFTYEANSDLLAELDVWNAIQNIKEIKKEIKLEEMGINENAYRRIKEQIEKMHIALDGVVEMKSDSKKRECIRKASGKTIIT